MIAKQLISSDIPALALNQTGKDAFHLLSEHHVRHLPVVENNRLIGVISEEDIFNHKLYEPISEYDFTTLRGFAVQETDHLFEIMRILGEHRLTVVPVINREGEYQGLISQNDLMRAFALTTSFSEPGGILVLEMEAHNYSLAEIARLAEDENTKILSSFITSTLQSETIEVTLKCNRHDLGRFVASLERHEYIIKESFDESDYSGTIKERFAFLEHYLNV